MSREAYNPDGATPFTGPTTGAGTTVLDLHGPKTTYLCGECNAKVELSRGDPIRCKECGHRVLYKSRTTRLVQFEAR